MLCKIRSLRPKALLLNLARLRDKFVNLRVSLIVSFARSLSHGSMSKNVPTGYLSLHFGYLKVSFLLSALVKGTEICYNKSRTTVYFDFFERDGESSSFHLWLSYSLHKPYKSFSRRASTSGLLHGLVPLSRNARRSDTRLRKSSPCSATSARFAIQIGVVLIHRERRAI